MLLNIFSPRKRNEEEEFRQIVEQNQRRLYWHLRRLLNSHEDAEDVLQETFYKAYKSFRNKECAAMSKRKAERTDAETEEVIKYQFEMAKQKVEIREKYYTKFRKFLTPKQIEKIYDSERNFMKRLQSEKRKRTNPKPMR